ncbi:hypothetical protein AURDEDRAFT_163759 [Auricularia subglabra TFB-10046 SS5]|nr:hypothetical protein AURDEDRAFT_163759 [Auricularia subglabra TFB-10046 SS5]
MPAKTRIHRRSISFPRLALPAELVAEVLEYLSIDELWTAARVSRQFYAATWRAGLFIHRQLDWMPARGSIPGLDVLKDLVDHALRKDLRISLTLTWDGDDESDPEQRAEIYKAAQPHVDDILSVITTALPLLVYLSLELPDHFRPQLDSALRRPAPRLRTFEISRTLDDTPCITPLPLDLFAGSSPQLRALSLGTTTLPDEPISAFRHISFAGLEYSEVFPHITINRHFPSITGLRLAFFTADSAASPQRFELSGLALHRIIIDDGDATGMAESVARSIDLSTVPVVQAIGDSITWSESLWSSNKADLSIRVAQWPEKIEDLCVLVVPAHLLWRRLYRLLVWDTGMTLPIRDMPNIGMRMRYLRIDSLLVRSFLKLELTLTALRDIHIDMRSNGLDCYKFSPPGYYAECDLKSFEPRAEVPTEEAAGAPYVCAPCPALEELTLFALDAPIAGVESRRVAFLARALGQLGRPKRGKAALALIGVDFERPVARVLLGQTVSKIRRYAFAGQGSCEDYDEGLWEEGL